MNQTIYKLENLLTGEMYIGATTNYYMRKAQHKSFLKTGTHKNSRLQEAFDRDGWEHFDFEVLHQLPEDTNKEELQRMEEWYMDYYKPEYNMTIGANGKTEESKTKIGKVQRDNSSLTEEDVVEIRARYVCNKRGHGYNAIAKDYGVTAMAIRDIIQGKTWKGVA